ncbi:MAG: DUF6288 domain-containing protein [Lentisphaeria bacterium]|nr:DUF6288 domain-containing protein [Lentisphaeria bacterium]
MIHRFHYALLLFVFIVMGLPARGGGVRFSRHYSDNMVLQRGKPVVIRGFADEGTDVTITFAPRQGSGQAPRQGSGQAPRQGSGQAAQTKKTKADENGEWSVTLDPMPASSAGAELRCQVSGVRNPVVLKDVVVGDVFLFARQTSIDVSLGRDEVGRKAAADVPSARVMMIRALPAYEPQPDLAPDATRGWTAIDKTIALKMSAAAFYAAKDLVKTTDVPVGIIDLNLGYHFPIAWLSKDALLETKEIFGEKAGQVDTMIEMMAAARTAYENPSEDQKKKDARRGYPRSPALEDARHPAAGHNAVLHPMRGLALKGLLLQLGNDYPYYLYAKLQREGKITSRPHLGQAYEDSYDIRKWCLYLEPLTIPRLPREWRKTFGDESLPVGLITPPGSDLVTMGIHHCEVRELQRQTAEKETRVDLIPPGTEHVPFSAQPTDEALLGERCLTWLTGAVYKKEGAVPTGPVFERVETNGSEARVLFKPGTANGLTATPGALDHFEIAGFDLDYSPAEATLDGDTIRLASDTVETIAHVRYNWTEKPDQGLTNGAGLPAVPFKTDDQPFDDKIRHPAEPLPPEFSIPISEWKTDGPVIYNGKLDSGSTGGQYLGPTGLRVTPFGPNLFVNNAYAGSPADGRILHGDYLYAVNGKPFVKSGDKDIYLQIADAITEAEKGKRPFGGADPRSHQDATTGLSDSTGRNGSPLKSNAVTEEANGLISFDLLRKDKKMTVELQLEVLGTYSVTAPYNCPKTDRIVANAEAYLARYGGVVPGHPAFADADAMFLLAAGSPEYQGLVRRHVYNRIAKTDLNTPIDPDGRASQGGPWDLSADILLISEYYLATGDKAVLPYLRHKCDGLTSIQIRPLDEEGPWPEVQPGQTGGWRHNFYGGAKYGTMPAIGVPAAIGYHLAREAGVQYDFVGYERAAQWFLHNGAKVGSIGYGYHATPVTTGNNPDPERLREGNLGAGNGGVGGAAILFDLRGDGPVARTCSLVATHTYNNTWYAHGGHFWLNLYTPLGAKVAGRKQFEFFMKGNRGYQELHRMHDHSRQQDRVFGAGQYLAYVAPRERLRILGAHESVFAPNPPAALAPALDAYFKCDYAASEKAVRAILDKGELYGLDLKKARQLRDAAALIQRSIALDLAKVKGLIAENKPYEASLDLDQLKAVMPESDAELAAIGQQLSDPALKQALQADKKRYDAYLKTLPLQLPEPKMDAEEEGTGWKTLVRAEGGEGGDPALWRIKTLEALSLAPEGWNQPGFDDSTWTETTLPISWRDNHTAVLRARFDIADPNAVGALRLAQYAYRQDAIQVFINGSPVARITESGGGSRITVPLNDHAVKLLRKGTNTLAATYKHNWRWGRYFKGGASVYNGGVNLTLEMRENK